jgi:hypothetical protein
MKLASFTLTIDCWILHESDSSKMPAAVMAIAGILMSTREAGNRKTEMGEAKENQKSLPSISAHEPGCNPSALHADNKDVEKDWA